MTKLAGKKKNSDIKKPLSAGTESGRIQNLKALNMKSNLAHEPPIPQGEVVQFPKKERQAMSRKEDGYTRMPNTLIDDQIMAQTSDKAFKCLMLIVRQTTGFDRTSHPIATTQFQKFCGIKKEETVTKMIRELEQLKLISVGRKKGCLNTYTPTLNQYHEKGLPPSNDSTHMKGGCTTPTEQGYTTPMKRGANKETLKENIKETLSLENPPEIAGQDDSWKPNLDFLKTVLKTTKFSQRTDEILAMTDFEFHLGNFNAHWENKITLTENQKTRKFATWIASEFESQLNKIERTTKNKPSLNINDAWADIPQFAGEVTRVEIPEDFI